jgi:hypothetical protein
LNSRRSASSSSAVLAKKAKASGPSLLPAAETGHTAIALAMREGASAARRCVTIPVIEWPRTWKRRQPRRSASARQSAAISFTVNSPGSAIDSP